MLDSGKYKYGNSRVSVSLESTIQSGKWVVKMQIEGIIGITRFEESAERDTLLSASDSQGTMHRDRWVLLGCMSTVSSLSHLFLKEHQNFMVGSTDSGDSLSFQFLAPQLAV